jgi:hypothetical protein
MKSNPRTSCPARFYRAEQDRFLCSLDGNGCSYLDRNACNKYITEFGSDTILPERRDEPWVQNEGWEFQGEI